MLSKNEDGVEKFEIIAPLLAQGLTPCKKRRLRSEIMETHGISERTLRRYVAAYKKFGFEGLLPKTKLKGYLKAMPEKVLEAAIQLKRELPERGVRRIITIMEKEGTISAGAVKTSNLIERGRSRLLEVYAAENARRLASGPIFSEVTQKDRWFMNYQE